MLSEHTLVAPGVHNAKAEECTTPRIGIVEILKYKLEGGGCLEIKNSYRCC